MISTATRILACALLGAGCSSGRAGGDDDDDRADAAIAACQATAAGSFGFEKIATWPDDTRAAYSMIPWADLNRPTWGTTMNLMAVAKGKLQAIDWGVSNAASSFEIFIDDVELY